MRVIRCGVFETNSSSTHSITIAGEQCTQRETLPVEDGMCRIYPGKFGWEERTYFDAATKASYCLTWAKQCENDATLGMLRRVVASETNAEVLFCESVDDYYKWGDIDHQSNHIAAEAFESDNLLRHFIFCPESILVTDNDNH